MRKIPHTLYRLPGKAPGLVQKGNIDLLRRLSVAVPNPAGGRSSVFSTSYTIPRGMPNAGKEVLIPQVIHQGGRWQLVSPLDALQYYLKTGKHLGVFANAKAADAYAERLHRQQAAGPKLDAYGLFSQSRLPGGPQPSTRLPHHYGPLDLARDAWRFVPSFPDDKKANARMKYEHDRALGRNPKRPKNYHS